MKKIVNKSILLMLVFSLVLSFPVLAAKPEQTKGKSSTDKVEMKAEKQKAKVEKKQLKAQEKATKTLDLINKRLDKMEARYDGLVSDMEAYYQVDKLTPETEELVTEEEATNDEAVTDEEVATEEEVTIEEATDEEPVSDEEVVADEEVDEEATTDEEESSEDNERYHSYSGKLNALLNQLDATMRSFQTQSKNLDTSSAEVLAVLDRIQTLQDSINQSLEGLDKQAGLSNEAVEEDESVVSEEEGTVVEETVEEGQAEAPVEEVVPTVEEVQTTP